MDSAPEAGSTGARAPSGTKCVGEQVSVMPKALWMARPDSCSKAWITAGAMGAPPEYKALKLRKSSRETPGWFISATKAVMAPMVKLGRCSRMRSEEHTSELQSQSNLVCRLLLEKKKINSIRQTPA